MSWWKETKATSEREEDASGARRTRTLACLREEMRLRPSTSCTKQSNSPTRTLLYCNDPHESPPHGLSQMQRPERPPVAPLAPSSHSPFNEQSKFERQAAARLAQQPATASNSSST